MNAESFYDQMAPFYHLIFPYGFDSSIERHGAALDGIIRETWGSTARHVLDVSCGIGTQALGLANLGYRVTASDISARAVRRAKQEAAQRNLAISFSVADMRSAQEHHAARFDVVLSADNSVPHLLNDQDILHTFQGFYACCKPGGGCLITIRDYESEHLKDSEVITYGLRYEEGTRYLVFQVREPNGPFHEISMFFVQDSASESPRTHVMRATYYAIKIPRLMQLLQDAGFVDVKRCDDVYFQPVVVGNRGFG